VKGQNQVSVNARIKKRRAHVEDLHSIEDHEHPSLQQRPLGARDAHVGDGCGQLFRIVCALVEAQVAVDKDRQGVVLGNCNGKILLLAY
jgi:hypothetical protein